MTTSTILSSVSPCLVWACLVVILITAFILSAYSKYANYRRCSQNYTFDGDSVRKQ